MVISVSSGDTIPCVCSQEFTSVIPHQIKYTQNTSKTGGILWLTWIGFISSMNFLNDFKNQLKVKSYAALYFIDYCFQIQIPLVSADNGEINKITRNVMWSYNQEIKLSTSISENVFCFIINFGRNSSIYDDGEFSSMQRLIDYLF